MFLSGYFDFGLLLNSSWFNLTRDRFSLIRFRSPLLTESLLFSLPDGTEMFHFPSFPPNTLYIQVQVTGHISSRVSPFGHPRITARLPAPRGLSQAPTSFIGSWCQGIHRVPLKTYTHKKPRPRQHPPQKEDANRTGAYMRRNKLKMLTSTIQFTSNNQNQNPHPNTYPPPESSKRFAGRSRPAPETTDNPRPFPQDPTACPHTTTPHATTTFQPSPKRRCTSTATQSPTAQPTFHPRAATPTPEPHTTWSHTAEQ